MGSNDSGKHSDTNRDRPAKQADVTKEVAKELGDAVAEAIRIKRENESK